MIDFAIEYAKHFIGVPYEWGGDNSQGLDCSGFVGVVLRSVGIMKNSEDLTSREMYDKFKWALTLKPKKGCVVFYGESIHKISHVAFMVDDRHILEAGGGNSKTTTIDVADEQNAMVRARPFNYRFPVAIVDPFYNERKE